MHCNIIETSLTDEWQPRMSTPSPSTTPRSTRTATSRSSLTRGSPSSTPEIRKRESSIPPFSTRSTEKRRSPHFPKSSARCGRGTDILAPKHVSRVIRYRQGILIVLNQVGPSGVRIDNHHFSRNLFCGEPKVVSIVSFSLL